MQKTLKTIWIIFSLCWSAMLIWVFLLGAGMSPGDANISIGFFLYWLAPIVVPALLYRVILKLRSRHSRAE